MGRFLTIEVIILLIISWLIFIFANNFFIKPSLAKSLQKSTDITTKYINVPQEASNVSKFSQIDPVSKKWVSNDITLVATLDTGGTGSPKDKILLSLSEQSETAKVPSDKRIAEVEKYILDPRMVNLLKETPHGFQQKEINDASGEGITELKVNTLGSVSVFWLFDKSKITQNQDVSLYSSYKDLKKKLAPNSFYSIGPLVIAALFLDGFEKPGSSIFFLAYLLLLTALLAIIISKFLKITSIIYANLIFIMLLFITVPVLSFTYYISLQLFFGPGG